MHPQSLSTEAFRAGGLDPKAKARRGPLALDRTGSNGKAPQLAQAREGGRAV